MKLLLKRIYRGAKYTIGKLYIDGVYFCDTLEDTVRELPETCPNTNKGTPCTCKEKVYGHTAIPSGIYSVKMAYSPRFKQVLPRLESVPHFLGILIHSGNTNEHSLGCILVGKNKVRGMVVESRETSAALCKLLSLEKDITIQIIP